METLMSENNTPVDSSEQPAPPMDENGLAGLALLWQAHAYAQDAGAELWDFALEIGGN
jgi:hypothetical protein